MRKKHNLIWVCLGIEGQRKIRFNRIMKNLERGFNCREDVK